MRAVAMFIDGANINKVTSEEIEQEIKWLIDKHSTWLSVEKIAVSQPPATEENKPS